MKNLLKKFVPVALALTLFVGIVAPAFSQAAGAPFRVVQTPTLHLYTGVSAVATSMRVTPFPKDLDGNKLTMTDFGSSTTLTIDPKVSNVEEIVGFTAIIDNGDNTATFTGLSRNLTSKYPYTTTGTGRTHGAGAVVVFGNNPQVYGQLAAKANDETITGYWLVLDPLVAQGIASKNYVDGKAFAGIGNASEVATGTVEIAAKSEVAAGTTNGTLGRLAIPASAASSTFSNATVSSNTVVVTTLTGKIDDNYISTSTLLAATSTINIGSFPAWQIGKNAQVFTSTGTTTFTVPSGITKVKTTVIGAGGAGGGCSTGGSNAGDSGGGGGGGGTAIEFVDVTGTTTIQVFVGTGGSGSAGNSGTAGTWSTFGTNGFYNSASGGALGVAEGDGGAGGVGSGGLLNLAGGGAQGGTDTLGETTSGGQGGDSFMGGGGAGLSTSNGSAAGGNYGGGGSGGNCVNNSQTISGGSGANGLVIVEW